MLSLLHSPLQQWYHGVSFFFFLELKKKSLWFDDISLLHTFDSQNNITEIRADALKLLAMMRRPIPRADATIGAWLNIFQV